MEQFISFDSSKLPKASKEYVLWVDIMGTKSIMSKWRDRSANFIFKFHSVIEKNLTDKLKCYPVMDGAFISSSSRAEINKFIKVSMRDFMKLMTDTKEHKHQFIVKGALSFGPVYHGKDISALASPSLSKDYKENLMLGIPMVQAVSIEESVPPFGVMLHESVRSFGDGVTSPYVGKYFKWFNTSDSVEEYIKQITNYFTWCINHINELDMAQEKSERYISLSKEYFRSDC